MGNTAPVREVDTGQRRLGVIDGSLDGAGDNGTYAIGADDDTCLLRDCCTIQSETPDASHTVAIHQDLLHRKAFAHLHARTGSGIDKYFVEHAPPWAV